MSSSPETTSRSRYAIPLVIGVFSLLFVFLVIYQVTSGTSPTTDRPTLPPIAEFQGDGDPVSGDGLEEADFGDDAADGDTPPVEVPSDLAGIRKALMEYLDYLRYDRQKYMDNGALVAQMLAELEEFLAGLPPEAVPMLLEILDSEEDFVLRRKILYGLGAIGSAEAALGLADYYEKLINLEADKDSEIAHTIRALGEVDSDVSFDLLEDFITTENGRQKHRFRFVQALGDHSNSAAAVPLFTDLMQDDIHFKVRNNAAQALKKASVHTTAPDLERAVMTEQNNYVRQTMMGALGSIGDTGSISTLENIARNDEDPVNRLSAVSAITKIGGSSAKSILEEIAAKDAHERVRYYAKKGVAKLEDDGW